MTYYVYVNEWGYERSHYAKVHLADCNHCNNRRGRKDIQNVSDVLSKWLGPFQSYQQTIDVATQTGMRVQRCSLCGPYR